MNKSIAVKAIHQRFNLRIICLAISTCSLPLLSHAQSPYFSFKDGDDFKRFSVSVGALHVMPQGNAQPIKARTAIKNGTVSEVGAIKSQTVKDNLKEGFKPSPILNAALNTLDTIPAALSGSATINGLESWNNASTGLEADDVTTLGIMSNYFFTDKISLEIKAGIPPKVDIKGKGQIYAPFSADAKPLGGVAGNLELENDIFITDLSKHGKVAEARAWTPAFEFQYHFGKTGVNKFRPYVGVGMMYAYFNDLELNPNLEKDLISAGHKIANIKNGQAGAALEGTASSANPKVKLDASDAFAPVVTAGFTYDFNDRWFGVGSVSYAHLTAEQTITVTDASLGKLIEAKSDIEINPILGYVGVGYRF